MQRLRWARVRVEGEVVGQCAHGLLVLVAAHKDDGPGVPSRMADKIAGLRIFGDAETFRTWPNGPRWNSLSAAVSMEKSLNCFLIFRRYMRKN